jgi:hypothetical protein
MQFIWPLRPTHMSHGIRVGKRGSWLTKFDRTAWHT